MAWTYGDDPGIGTAAQRRDAVRLSTGDTDTSDQQLSDAEIAWYLDLGDDNVEASAIRAVEALVAKYSRQADTRIGDLSVKASSRATHYRALLKTLKARTAIEAEVYAGGQTLSGKDSLNDDADAIKPHFVVGMDRHPASRNDSGWADD